MFYHHNKLHSNFKIHNIKFKFIVENIYFNTFHCWVLYGLPAYDTNLAHKIFKYWNKYSNIFCPVRESLRYIPAITFSSILNSASNIFKYSYIIFPKPTFYLLKPNILRELCVLCLWYYLNISEEEYVEEERMTGWHSIWIIENCIPLWNTDNNIRDSQPYCK